MDKQEFERQAKQVLDEHAAGLDGETASALHRARSLALDVRQTRSPRVGAFTWVGSGAIAASFALAVVFYNQPLPPLPEIYEDPVQQAAAEELELMDDLEFIAWLMLEEDLANETGNQS